MGKQLRRRQDRLAARIKGTLEARAEAVRKNSKLSGVIDKAFRMPGSVSGRK